MRTRDSAHEAELKQIAALPEEQLLRRIQLDHTEVGHVPSEVLATIVRTHFGRAAGVIAAAVAMLNRRIQLIVGKRWQGAKDRPEVERRGGQAFTDAIDYIWLKFFEDKAPLSNAEVRFGVFVRDRLDDFLRHLRTEMNSMDSVDGMQEAHEGAAILEGLEDPDGESPEEALEKKQLSAAAVKALMNLPRQERDAFYFRAELRYEWKQVAQLLRCSVPTARSR
ncbi:hypothetical protein WS70_11900 [Burkholderia mayonis]|uniref:Uncharacterized protein n=2 Tax=Burkholderiaceae TaxID=119060 RepID=A0A1B4FFZ7_9BURK|nr:hypothetical protein WS70_11900 [Burkholderia mayonis]KVE42149.1 hypothetical protein WS69_25895 [Burkholderia sp. BDU5]KVE48666.1 hypothetical protein WS70_21645 [Burkholderia mayonis]